ncbi:ATP-binding protein [Nereida sp. NH-UV-3]|uniref:ATP-binding protein n=1 Tax=Nereida TaxID=282198 RepID=UPI0036F29266
MSVNIFYANKPVHFNDCYFAEPAIKQELSSYANNPLNGCVLLYGAYGTGKSTAVELIAHDRGAAKSDIHYVHANGSQFGELRKSSLLLNAMQWGVINHQTPVLIVDEVDVLSKENQLWLRSFIDDWQHRALILLTTNYIGNLDGSIRDRCDCLEVRGFTALQAAQLIHQVLAQHDIKIAVSRIEQQAQLELSSEDALLSLRTVGRLCDKLALQVSATKLRVIK